MVLCPSAAGYEKNTAKLIEDYESCSFAFVFQKIMHFFPALPCQVLDIGAGSGRDAAAFSKRGHTVTAVEPTDAMRQAAQSLHDDTPITWVDAALPDLAPLQGTVYDFILVQAVWMHLTIAERDASMQRVAALLAPSGKMVITLRHGPVPEGRRMFAITPAETVTLAAEHGLSLVQEVPRDDLHGRQEISWSFLCLQKTC